MPYVLCRIVWADEYKSKGESFFPGNKKYPAKNKIAHELLNFTNEGGYAYGYVESNDSWMDLENLGASAGTPELDGVTAIWCALDRAAIQKDIEHVKTQLKATQDQAKARLEQAKAEMDARIKALQDQAKGANDRARRGSRSALLTPRRISTCVRRNSIRLGR